VEFESGDSPATVGGLRLNRLNWKQLQMAKARGSGLLVRRALHVQGTLGCLGLRTLAI